MRDPPPQPPPPSSMRISSQIGPLVNTERRAEGHYSSSSPLYYGVTATSIKAQSILEATEAILLPFTY